MGHSTSINVREKRFFIFNEKAVGLCPAEERRNLPFLFHSSFILELKDVQNILCFLKPSVPAGGMCGSGVFFSNRSPDHHFLGALCEYLPWGVNKHKNKVFLQIIKDLKDFCNEFFKILTDSPSLSAQI